MSLLLGSKACILLLLECMGEHFPELRSAMRSDHACKTDCLLEILLMICMAGHLSELSFKECSLNAEIGILLSFGGRRAQVRGGGLMVYHRKGSVVQSECMALQRGHGPMVEQQDVWLSMAQSSGHNGMHGSMLSQKQISISCLAICKLEPFAALNSASTCHIANFLGRALGCKFP